MLSDKFNHWHSFTCKANNYSLAGYSVCMKGNEETLFKWLDHAIAFQHLYKWWLCVTSMCASKISCYISLHGTKSCVTFLANDYLQIPFCLYFVFLFFYGVNNFIYMYLDLGNIANAFYGIPFYVLRWPKPVWWKVNIFRVQIIIIVLMFQSRLIYFHNAEKIATNSINTPQYIFQNAVWGDVTKLSIEITAPTQVTIVLPFDRGMVLTFLKVEPSAPPTGVRGPFTPVEWVHQGVENEHMNQCRCIGPMWRIDRCLGCLVLPISHTLSNAFTWT